MTNASIEGPLVKVPFESLKRLARTRKSHVDGISQALTGLEASTASDTLTREQALERVATAVNQLTTLKRKLEDSTETETSDAARCRTRVAHLIDTSTPPPPGGPLQWNAQRMDRILVDYMLRSGFHTSAAQLTADSKLQDIVDSHIFIDASHVTTALQQHDCGPAAAWCERHAARLAKVGSRLRFELTLQQFLELVREDRMMDAIQHARQHLAPFAPQHMKELQRAMATLATTARTTSPAYAPLFHESRWASLAAQFHQDLYKLHCLPRMPLLHVHLQAGLSALKGPPGCVPQQSIQDPLSREAFQALAESLPHAKHTQTKLVCAITRETMNDANPPMVLPNGNVFSQRAIDAMLERTGGRVVCPLTGLECGAEDLKRAYIL